MRLLPLIYCIALLTWTTSVQASDGNYQRHEVSTSPFNGISITSDSIGDDYSFFVSGHFYGGGGNVSGYPASTLLANIDMINASGKHFLMCNGDLFKDVQSNIPLWQKSLFSKLKIPLFNAVGNHDLSDNVYQENFGKTYYSFMYNGDLFMVLDAETDGSQISGDQFSWFHQVLLSAPNKANIFIFSHRPIWAEDDETLSKAFPDNTKSLTGSNFDDVFSKLSYMETHNIYWFSGSLGNAPASFFYHEVAGTKIHYIQTAIRDLRRDAMLSVSIKDRKVGFETVSLTGQKLEPLEHYNLEFWMQDRPAEEFNSRLIPYYIELMATHRYFWYGVLYTLGGILALAFLRRWRSKRRSR
jgi:hypothetical protein